MPLTASCSTRPVRCYDLVDKMQQRSRARAATRGQGHASEGPLGYAMIKKLKIYAQGSHPHSAQMPKALDLSTAQLMKRAA